jgi:quercetin dioxygenase-like cupin family protein
LSSRGFVCAVLFAITASAGPAQETQTPAAAHTMVPGDRIAWGPAPPALPKGAQAVVLSGNPAEPGPFTMRLKLPAGYRIPPHRHPVAEYQTVLEGTYSVGKGERFDAAALHAMPAGSFSIMPAGMPHFGFTKEGAVLQVHGNGPFTVTYVDPADDPRKPAAN